MKIASIFCVILIVFIEINVCIIPWNGEIYDAKEGDIPYIALIKVRHPHTGRFMPICAGAIISERDILTNAVCASACQHLPNCKLYVGRVNTSAGGTEITMESTVWHPSYVQMDMVNHDNTYLFVDLGIIHTENIPLSDTVKIIKIAPIKDVLEGRETLLIAGWGAEPDPDFKIEPRVRNFYH